MMISAQEAYQRWSASYDSTPNPITALEHRLLSSRMDPEPGSTFLDAGCGTGRWMAWAAARGAKAFGVDCCAEMIHHAAARSHCSIGDVLHLPFADESFDTAICSFTLGYVRSIVSAFEELARVARQVIVTDLHPDALERGWRRSFHAQGEKWEIENRRYSLLDLNEAASQAGLTRCWLVEARLGEPERAIFAEAGREFAFASATQFPAVFVSAWNQPSY